MLNLKLAKADNYKWWVFGAITVGLFASVTDFGSVAVALPSIAEYFETELPTAQWVAIGYALTISALLLPMGRLGDMVGLKRIYVIGFIFFSLGAGLAGFSTDITALILFRVIQGAGAAMTQGSGMAMLISSFPHTERGRVLGLLISVVGIGAVAGPVLGGAIVDRLGWQWVFFTTLILGVLSTITAMVILDESPTAKGKVISTFDWLGAALSASGLVIFMVAITTGPRLGWVSPPVLIAFLTFAGLLGSFVWWELRTPSPMVDMSLFAHRPFSLGISGTFISFIGMSAVGFLMPFYLQSVLGYTPTQMGLIIVPSALSLVIMGPISGRLSDRYGWRRFNIGGLLLCVTALFLLATLRTDSPLGIVMAGMILHSTGMGIFNAPNSSSIFSAIEQSKFGVVAGFLNLARNSANITSIALVTAIVTATMASMGHPPSLTAVSEATTAELLDSFVSGIKTVYFAVGCLVLLGVVTSFVSKQTPKQVVEFSIAD